MEQNDTVQRLSKLSEVLQQAQDSLQSARDIVQRNADTLRETDKSDEMQKAIRDYLNGTEQLLNLSTRLKTRLDPKIAQAGEFKSLFNRLEELRKAHTDYEKKFDELWGLSLPFQLRAILHQQNTSKEKAWAERWGEKAAPQALEILQNSPDIKAEDRQEREFLLTLRYAKYPGQGYTSYQEMARILNQSSTLLFNRFSSTEKLIKTVLKSKGIPFEDDAEDESEKS